MGGRFAGLVAVALAALAVPAQADHIPQPRPGTWILNNDRDDPIDRSLSFTLSRDRKELRDVRIELHLRCYKLSEGRGRIRERRYSLRIATVPLAGRRTAEPGPVVGGVRFSGRFRLDPPRGPWLFEAFAEAAGEDAAGRDEFPEPDDPQGGRCSGGGNGHAVSGFDRETNRCVRNAWRREVLDVPRRERARAKRRLSARCRAAAARRFPLPRR